MYHRRPFDTLNFYRLFFTDSAKEGRATVADTEKKLRPLSELIYFGEQYEANKKYHARYKKSKDPERYYQDHRTELTLHDGAKAFLEREGINLAHFKLKALKATRDSLTAAKTSAAASYKSAEAELKNWKN